MTENNEAVANLARKRELGKANESKRKALVKGFIAEGMDQDEAEEAAEIELGGESDVVEV